MSSVLTQKSHGKQDQPIPADNTFGRGNERSQGTLLKSLKYPLGSFTDLDGTKGFILAKYIVLNTQ